MTFEEAKQQATGRPEWVLCHGAGYYTARTPDSRDIIGKGENWVFVGGEYRRIVVRVHKATDWHGTKRPNFRFRGRRGSIRSRIRILPPPFPLRADRVLFGRRDPRPGQTTDRRQGFRQRHRGVFRGVFLGVLSGRRIYAKSRVLRGVRGE